jgi:hypothetical protein
LSFERRYFSPPPSKICNKIHKDLTPYDLTLCFGTEC